MTTAAWIGAILLGLIVLIGLGLVLFTRNVARKVEAAVPADGRFVEVDGHRLHYVDSAAADPQAETKPAIVMVHGLGGQMRNMTHSLFDRLTAEFRVIALDRPGTGWSTRLKGSSHGPLAQGAVVARFIEALGLDRPVVVGHSLGGAIALATGLDYPRSVSGLVLVAPLTQPTEDVPEVFRAIMIRNAGLRRATAWTLATPFGIRNGPAGLAMVFGPEGVPEDFGTRGGGLLSLRPVSFETASADIMAIPDDMAAMVARYDELSVPVAVIHGTRDAITPFATNAQAFADRTGASLKALEGAGHMIPITQADAVAGWIAEHARQWTVIKREAA